MPEQELNGSQVRAGFQQMSGEAVPQGVRVNFGAEAGPRGRFAAGVPHHFRADRTLCRVPAVAGEQPRFWLPPETAPVSPEFIQELGAQHDLAIFASLSDFDVDDHMLPNDI